MLRYLRWISISGVWIPILIAVFWLDGGELIFAISPRGSALENSASVFLFLGMLFIPFISAHALLISSLIGLCLYLTDQAKNRGVTLISAFVGLSIGSFLLARIYL
jgi:hypothetical protein